MSSALNANEAKDKPSTTEAARNSFTPQKNPLPLLLLHSMEEATSAGRHLFNCIYPSDEYLPRVEAITLFGKT
jgi:hypothetical protein